MSLTADLNVINPLINGNQPAINNSVDVSNLYNQQTPYSTPFPANTNLITNFSQPQRKFLDALSEYAAAVPISSFWVVQFKIPSLISEQNLNQFSESFKNNDLARYSIADPKLTRNIGCIFCRSFDFVGESNTSTVPEMDYRGFRSVPYAGGRSSALFQNLRLTFYESTISFVDHIIRPWVILMSYYSTIARNNGNSANDGIYDLKQDLSCFLMTRTGVGQTPEERLANNRLNNGGAIPNYNNPWGVRRTIIFKNCFPKDMGTLNFTQDDRTGLEIVPVNFCYTNYEIIHTPLATP